jgi:hypothetical protein
LDWDGFLTRNTCHSSAETYTSFGFVIRVYILRLDYVFCLDESECMKGMIGSQEEDATSSSVMSPGKFKLCFSPIKLSSSSRKEISTVEGELSLQLSPPCRFLILKRSNTGTWRQRLLVVFVCFYFFFIIILKIYFSYHYIR